MSTEPFIGEIKLVGFNFTPVGYAYCHGQLLSIAQNPVLFSLIGTIYGGDGQTTFALPDLRGRVPIHQGNGPGLTPRTIGERSGEEYHTLISTEIPQHSHPTPAATASSATAPTTALAHGPAQLGSATWPSFGTPTTTSAPTGFAGGNQPHNNMQPYTVINAIIAVEGIYPSRN
jgi:microcystin-dependent protein